jgi:DNA-binding MarR family transcriptional regulator
MEGWLPRLSRSEMSHQVVALSPEHDTMTQESETGRGHFKTEGEMLPLLHDAAKQIWVKSQSSGTWVLLDEQRLHSRIADLAVIRLDVDAVRIRKKEGWLRPLRLQELRALRSLRRDRQASVALVASQMRVSQAAALEVLRDLAGEGFVTRDETGTFRRIAPITALAERIITVEAKRDNPRAALQQARAHRAWTDETYVAFDASFSTRFRKRDKEWRQLGIGLIEVGSDHWRRVYRARPHRRSNRLEAALIGELALDRLLRWSAENRPERRLPHGDRLSGRSAPVVLGPKARWVRALEPKSSN